MHRCRHPAGAWGDRRYADPLLVLPPGVRRPPV